jgi:hypothetical protein
MTTLNGGIPLVKPLFRLQSDWTQVRLPQQNVHLPSRGCPAACRGELHLSKYNTKRIAQSRELEKGA